MCVNNLPRVALDTGAARIQTSDILIASVATYQNATEPHTQYNNAQGLNQNIKYQYKRVNDMHKKEHLICEVHQHTDPMHCLVTKIRTCPCTKLYFSDVVLPRSESE